MRLTVSFSRPGTLALALGAALTLLVGCSTGADTTRSFPGNGGSTGAVGTGGGAGVGGVAGSVGGAGGASGGFMIPDANPDAIDDGPGVVTTDGPAVTSVTIQLPSPSMTVTVSGDGANATVTGAPVQFTATAQDGRPLNVGWSVDRGEIGSIDGAGTFTASGKVGGVVTIRAGFGATGNATASFAVKIVRTQNGSSETPDLTAPGGYGGVGGEGPGGALLDADLATLKGTALAEATRKLVYPYQGTVFPRGLLAPLIQWNGGDADGVRIHLETKSQYYVYDGYFAKPAAASPFQRHPIPQDVWKAITQTAGGDETLTLGLTFLVGGKASGPLSETWIVAPARLSGTLYYNAYNTLLVKNEDAFGAAILSIKPGETSPKVAAGRDTQPGEVRGTGCRACHTVSSKGNRLLVNDDEFQYRVASSYDLTKQPPPETALRLQNVFAWSTLSPDGSRALTNTTYMGAANDKHMTELYQLDAAGNETLVATTGLSNLGTPVFSHDGKHVAGTAIDPAGAVPGDGRHIVALDFDGTATFGNPRSLFALDAADDPNGAGPVQRRVGFPSFLPQSNGVVLQKQIGACGFGVYIGTSGTVGTTDTCRGELWWAEMAGRQAKLNLLNGLRPDGTSYLPTGAIGHDADATLNYEPTVAPVASGGYAWVVFTSRRLYGNVATNDPMQSDPRTYDPSTITTKKLWLAAIDLSAAPGADPSHPAFYLPAQELHGSNSRGYWVFDPCKADGASCETGDQCCGGYCQPNGANGALICSDKKSSCSQYNEKCTTAADCCDKAALCVNGFCSTITHNPPVVIIY
jgi:hypothetical protein